MGELLLAIGLALTLLSAGVIIGYYWAKCEREERDWIIMERGDK